MAEDSKKGPVKPPIIDAKPASKSEDQPKTATVKPTAKSSPSKPATKPSSQTASKSKTADATPTAKKSGAGFGVLIIATLLGASLGTGATSFMALNNIAPFQKSASETEFNAAIEMLQKRVFDLESVPATDLSDYVTSSDLDGLSTKSEVKTLNAAQAELAKLATSLNEKVEINSKAVASLPVAAENQTAVDFTPQLDALHAELQALKTSIIEISPDQSGAIEQQIAQNEKLEKLIINIAELRDGMGANAEAILSNVEQIDAAMITSSQNLASITALANKPAPTGNANLPLIFGAWETALFEGKPYDAFLSNVSVALPEIAISDQQMATAQIGVATAGQLDSIFADIIPSLVKSNSELSVDAPWYEKLAEQAKSVIGLRPLDQTGSDPLAITARLEAALKAGDVKSAASEFATLPTELQTPYREFARRLSSSAEAIILLENARAAALNSATQQGATQ